jgi:hypothetical protein
VVRVYVHVDPEALARADGAPLRIWDADGTIWSCSEVSIEGPSRLVHDPAGLETPDGRTLRVWARSAR